MAAFLILTVLIVFVVLCVGEAKKPRPTVKGYIRCPTCGAKIPIYGSTWECGFCCDSGYVGSKTVYPK